MLASSFISHEVMIADLGRFFFFLRCIRSKSGASYSTTLPNTFALLQGLGNTERATSHVPCRSPLFAPLLLDFFRKKVSEIIACILQQGKVDLPGFSQTREAMFRVSFLLLEYGFCPVPEYRLDYQK